jgi:hypothetical protein
MVSTDDLNGLVSFPNTYVTCADAIKTLQASGLDPVYWCQTASFTFSDRCCQTCQSKIFKLDVYRIDFFTNRAIFRTIPNRIALFKKSKIN